MSAVAAWRPKSWRTIDTSETVRKVTELSQDVTEQARHTQEVAEDLRELAARFSELEAENLRQVARADRG